MKLFQDFDVRPWDELLVIASPRYSSKIAYPGVNRIANSTKGNDLFRRNDGIIPSAIRWWLSSEMLLDVWLTECSQLSNILRILHFPIINSFTPIEKIKSNVIELNIRSVYNIFICSNKKLQVEVKKKTKRER